MSRAEVPEDGMHTDQEGRLWVLMDHNTWLRVTGERGCVIASNDDILASIERDNENETKGVGGGCW